MSNEDEKAAKAISHAWEGLPKMDEPLARAIAKCALGISRLGDKRWEDIKRGVERISMEPKETIAVPADPPKRPGKPHGGPSMGMLLSAQLRDHSADMDPEQNPAVLFCHCPHCEGAMRVNANVTKGV